MSAVDAPAASWWTPGRTTVVILGGCVLVVAAAVILDAWLDEAEPVDAAPPSAPAGDEAAPVAEA